MNLFISRLFSDPQLFFTWILLIVFSICCHEFMHAWTALRQGDPTAADAGHLTLNPLRQMGPFSLLLLAVCGIAWGSVPVRPGLMRHKYSDALVAFAGPATNLGLFLIFGVAAFFFGEKSELITRFFVLGSMLNAVLCLFNMLPIPGLDGFAVLSSFFQRIRNVDSEWLKGAFFVMFLLVFFSFRYFWIAGEWMLYQLFQLLKLMFG